MTQNDPSLPDILPLKPVPPDLSEADGMPAIPAAEPCLHQELALAPLPSADDGRPFPEPMPDVCQDSAAMVPDANVAPMPLAARIEPASRGDAAPEQAPPRPDSIAAPPPRASVNKP